MSKALDELRRKIDSLDDRIHDLLMERADLIAQVSAEKKRSGAPILQPAREVRMIRRLLGRHRGPLAPAAIARIWRELVGAVSLLQTDVHVAICVSEKNPALWDMARDYFGSVIPMQRTANPLTAIAQVREDESALAVLPWPEDGDENPWWAWLDEAGTPSPESALPLRIVVRLPHGESAEARTRDPAQTGLVVARAPFDATGDDRSFILIDADHSLSRARIVSVAKECGVSPASVHSRRGGASSARAQHLLEVEGYADAETVAALGKKLEDCAARCLCVGGYPLPLSFGKTGDRAEPSSASPGKRAQA